MQIDLRTPTAPAVVPPGGGRALWVAGFPHTVKLAGEQTGGAFALVEVEVPPGASPPPHQHSREVEAFVVLEGTFEFSCDGETFVSGPGAYVSLPVGTVHTWRCVGPETGRMVVVIVPGGFEGFFDEVGSPIVPGQAPPPADEMEGERVAHAASAYGLTLHLGGTPSE